jgi:ribosomal protein S9
VKVSKPAIAVGRRKSALSRVFVTTKRGHDCGISGETDGQEDTSTWRAESLSNRTGNAAEQA